MNVLIACEYSGVVRDAFSVAGHHAVSCDLLPSESLGNHYQGDVFDILSDGWDLLIAHPPCTYLSYAANHCWNAPGREALRNEAMGFFMRLYNAPVERVCIENPVGLPDTEFRKPDQIIHPYYFGDSALKRTCFWLRGLPLLFSEREDTLFDKKTFCNKPKPFYRRRSDGKAIHFSEAKHGGHIRSRSFPAIAKAMSQQWSDVSLVSVAM